MVNAVGSNTKTLIAVDIIIGISYNNGMPKYLTIEYSKPDGTDSIAVPFKLRGERIVTRWVNQVQEAIKRYPIDDPARFYGFGTVESQAQIALNLINSCVDNINAIQPLATRKLADINDQDTLNYLHHVFEVNHGLLDASGTKDQELKKHLCDLNILVHRCETVARGARPRHVVTWFGLPKSEQLDIIDYEMFTNKYEFGTVYLNYVEIGKTLEDLSNDRDNYISDEAFQPFKHFSADFNVKYFDVSQEEVQRIDTQMLDFWHTHNDFFVKRGLYGNHPLLRPGSIPVATIEYSGNVLEDIATRQFVKSVSFN